MTTLELARRCAGAARAAADAEAAAVAVLNALHDTDTWFCRWHGEEADRGPEPLPYEEQLPLFPQRARRRPRVRVEQQLPLFADPVPPPGDRSGTHGDSAWRERNER